ncbi:MAG: FtsW/RodA/SpoVE family cell cycle protein [Trueperaceae bacterium]|nr:MAG: FtsW/RodA/SpoVE family cell cycle protein [Trueperaceae bacterium]
MDPLLITIHLMLGALGVLAVSAGAPELALVQALRFLGCFVLMALIARVTPKQVVRASPYAYVVVLILLISVLIFGVSPQGSESKRWLLLGGVTIQPSELLKVSVIAYLTAFFHNHLGNWQIWRPMVVIGVAAGLVVVEPDVSTAIFLFALAFAIMLAAGTTLLRLISISTFAALIAFLVAGSYLSQYTYLTERITGFLDMKGPREYTSSTSYQAFRAQEALQRAGLFGIGPGRPVRVPEAETDMAAVSIGQSLGLVGIATLIILFVLLAARGIRIAAAYPGPGSLLAAGATTYICCQAGLNLLVTSGLFPVTGMPLPFVSYGLNSLVSVSIALGFIHSSYRYAVTQGVTP